MSRKNILYLILALSALIITVIGILIPQLTLDEWSGLFSITAIPALAWVVFRIERES